MVDSLIRLGSANNNGLSLGLLKSGGSPCLWSGNIRVRSDAELVKLSTNCGGLLLP